MSSFNEGQLLVAFLVGGFAGGLVVYIAMSAFVMRDFGKIWNLASRHLRTIAERLDERKIEQELAVSNKKLEQIVGIAKDEGGTHAD